MNKGQPINDQAHEWRVIMDDKPTPEEREAFSAWLEDDPRHYAAFERAITVWAAMKRLKYEHRRRQRLRIASWASAALAATVALFYIALPPLPEHMPERSLILETA
ncbi:MAG: DUF4880 domain-containing protein, partial [Pseudomonadota bacterium]